MKKLMNRFCHAVASVAFVGLLVGASEATAAGQSGSAEEAKAMVERAVVAIKTDKSAALTAFTAGSEGFKDRDLYVFCGGADGIMTAHGGNPALVGVNLLGLADMNGMKFGEAFYRTAKKGEIGIVEYVWPRPGETKPIAKRSFVTTVDDQMCGVGYYK